MSFANTALNWGKEHPRTFFAGIMGAEGAALGAATAYADPSLKAQLHKETHREGLTRGTKEYDSRLRQKRRKAAVTNTIMGGAMGAAGGAFIGHQLHKSHVRDNKRWEDFHNAYRGNTHSRYREGGPGYNRHYDGGRESTSTPDSPGLGALHKALGLSGKETTKKEVKKRYYKLVKKHHPDRGGNIEKIKPINNAWTFLQKHEWFHKLAFLRYFTKQAGLLNSVGDLTGVRTFRRSARLSRKMHNRGVMRTVRKSDLFGDTFTTYAKAHKAKSAQTVRDAENSSQLRLLGTGLATGAAGLGIAGYVRNKNKKKLEAEKQASECDDYKFLYKKHEARETIDQEGDESPKEQALEERLGVEKQAFFAGFGKQAFLGLGMTVAQSKNKKHRLTVGVPYIVGYDYALEPKEKWSPTLGIGLTGPHIGVTRSKTAFLAIGGKAGILGATAGAVAGGVVAAGTTKLSPDKKSYANAGERHKANLLMAGGAGLGSVAGHFLKHKSFKNLRFE